MRRLIPALVFIAAACASGSVAKSTTTTTLQPTPTTTTSTAATAVMQTTTTTLPPGPIVLPLLANSQNDLKLDAGVVYRYEHRPPVFELRFDDGGWRLDFVGETFIYLYNKSRETSIAGSITFLERPIAEILDELGNSEDAVLLTEPSPSFLGGLSGVAVEVESPIPERDIQDGSYACLLAGHTFTEETDSDRTLLVSATVGCAINRVWLLEHEDATVVVYAGDASLSERRVGNRPEVLPLEPVLDLIEELEAAVTFCTEATTCDG